MSLDSLLNEAIAFASEVHLHEASRAKPKMTPALTKFEADLVKMGFSKGERIAPKGGQHAQIRWSIGDSWVAIVFRPDGDDVFHGVHVWFDNRESFPVSAWGEVGEAEAITAARNEAEKLKQYVPVSEWAKPFAPSGFGVVNMRRGVSFRKKVKGDEFEIMIYDRDDHFVVEASRYIATRASSREDVKKIVGELSKRLR